MASRTTPLLRAAALRVILVFACFVALMMGSVFTADGVVEVGAEEGADVASTLPWQSHVGGVDDAGPREGFGSPERSKSVPALFEASSCEGSPPSPPPASPRGRATSHDIRSMYGGVQIPPSFDYSKSTEMNYAVDASVGPQFVGKYKDQRAVLDYSYHRHYSLERQLFHDRMMDLFHNTRVEDSDNNLVCDRPLENWIVFTAGPMGAGKGHTMQWLQRAGLFPLAAFVKVDPDSLRELLPETPEYIARNPTTAGNLTQKEVGYIAEVLTLEALQQGKNVLVDGSLKDAEWYLEYFRTLRQQFPTLKIAIIHVMAKKETVLARCRRRAETTGRVVPEEVIISAMEAIPNALKQLAPSVNYFATFENEDESQSPKLLMASRSVSTNDLSALLDGGSEGGDAKSAAAPGWQSQFKAVWKMQCAVPPSKAPPKASTYKDKKSLLEEL